jgi:hypothetical protein
VADCSDAGDRPKGVSPLARRAYRKYHNYSIPGSYIVDPERTSFLRSSSLKLPPAVIYSAQSTEVEVKTHMRVVSTSVRELFPLPVARL